MSLTTKERKQFNTHNVKIHPSEWPSQLAFQMARERHMIVFRESRKYPGDVSIFTPDGEMYRFSDFKKDCPTRFGPWKDAVNAIETLLKFPVHPQAAPQDPVVRAAALKKEVAAIRAENEKLKSSESSGNVLKRTP